MTPTTTPSKPLSSVVGRIAFTRATSQTEADIYLMHADGTNVQQVTASPGLDIMLAWSPDGAQIAFVSNRDGNWEIYIMNADGTNPRRLTNHPRDDGAPAWTPDGQRIAYTVDWSGSPAIYSMNVDGTNQTDLAPGNWPSWAPDGTEIIFTIYPGETLSVMQADGSNQRPLVENARSYEAAWSPSGESIAFVSDRDGNEEIYAMNSDGSDQRRLTAIPGNDHWPPSWSPDSTRIAFTSDGTGDNPDIFVMNADGSGLTQVTNDPGGDAFPAWYPALDEGSE
jgi:Tol biopolymer transport system component